MSQSDLQQQQQQQQPLGQPLLQRSSLSDYNTLPFKRLPAARRERQCKPCSISSMSGGGGAAPVQGTVMRWSQNEWKENWLVVGAPSQQMAGTSRRCHSEFIQSGGSRDLESPD
jgi:hypothetical protein